MYEHEYLKSLDAGCLQKSTKNTLTYENGNYNHTWDDYDRYGIAVKSCLRKVWCMGTLAWLGVIPFLS